MARIPLGGMSVSDGHCRLHVTCTNVGTALSDVCSSLGANRINITLLTHLAEDGRETCGIAPCLESADGFAGSFLLKRGQGAIESVTVQRDLCILSIFPHDRRPGVAGALLGLLARIGILPSCLAGSLSSLSVSIPFSDAEKVAYGLFETFDFPPTRSPSDWSAACRGRNGLLREIRCSYDERIIKVFSFSRQDGLDFWTVSAPRPELGRMGEALTFLGSLVMGLFFVMAHARPDGGFQFGFCLASTRSGEIEETFARYLPGACIRKNRPVTAISFQGPHFGDRPGITGVLADALQGAGVVPIAVSCAISSVSLVIRSHEADRAVEALRARFKEPS
ncbi:MAG: hypothetical protein ABFD98_19210 [Syntrophobacteraceae bacterium]|nr:hypothetical protein [Desulfobacteraceae bacterium]